MYKRRLVRWFVNWTDSWNREFHEAIEAKVHAEFRQLFPEGAQDTEAMIEKMRSFYYARMTGTSMLSMSIAALVIALLGIAVALGIAVFSGAGR